jgi:uncharacterized protein YqeY
VAIIQDIDDQLATSMREGVVARTAVLRLLKNALKNQQIKIGHELNDDEALRVLQREAKQRKDSIVAYKDGGRAELAAGEQAELEIVEEFLPSAMSEAELAGLIDKIIADTGSNDLSQMGVVIGAVMKEAGGAADGATVSRLVKQKLSA